MAIDFSPRPAVAPAAPLDAPYHAGKPSTYIPADLPAAPLDASKAVEPSPIPAAAPAAPILATYPALDGTIRVGFLPDFHMKHNPDRAIYTYSEGPGLLTSISYLEYGRAVHRASHHLRPGCAGSDSEVVAVIANVDVMLYQTLLVGLMRAGLTVRAQNCFESSRTLTR